LFQTQSPLKSSGLFCFQSWPKSDAIGTFNARAIPVLTGAGAGLKRSHASANRVSKWKLEAEEQNEINLE